MGVNGKLFNVIYNLYKGAKSYVKLSNQRSEVFSCLVGVRQGENLSPLLFAIFLNDSHNYLGSHYSGLQYLDTLLTEHSSGFEIVDSYRKLLLLLYADDTVIMAESAQELQKAIDGMCQYCEDWNLKINTSKTKVLVFSRGKIRNLPSIMFGNNKLEVVFDYVYLGCTFNYNGTFIKAIKRLYGVASRAMFSILSKSRSLPLDIDTQLHLFNSMVVPIMMYGSEVWGYTDLKLIERLQLRFCKIILIVKKSTPNSMVLGELGVYPIELYIKNRMLSFWLKQIQGNKCKLSYMLYQLVNNLDNISPWITYVQNILNGCGLQYIWYSQGYNIHINWLKEYSLMIYKDQFQQEWHDSIHNSNKCLVYRMFKTEFRFEKYLTSIPFKLRNLFTKFRCRSTRLPIESGVFVGIKRDDRVCTLCESHDIGDEFHYIFTCSFFSNDRQRYIESKYRKFPSAFNLNSLFNISGPRLTQLCKLTEIIMRNF